MAEILVALWLSCCKPHSPGRVNPTFKPKPRYRQPGQQQWHISNYPKTKCPSFVCNPHSGSSASQHMGLSLGGLRGFGVVLCSPLTALNCLQELRWLVVKVAWVINVQIFSVTVLLSQLFSLCCLALFFHCTHRLINSQTQITWLFDFKASNNWISKAKSLTKSLWIPLSLSGQWDLG